MRIVPPCFPYAGTRGVDAWGAGGFLAPRDAGARQHYGLDFLGKPKTTIVAVIAGTIGELGFMYADSPEMRNIHIIGTGEFEHYTALLGYVVPGEVGIKPGMPVAQGAPVGFLQDVAAYWKARRPTHPGEMQNHCHLGLKCNGTWVNPSHYLPTDLPTC